MYSMIPFKKEMFSQPFELFRILQNEGKIRCRKDSLYSLTMLRMRKILSMVELVSFPAIRMFSSFRQMVWILNLSIGLSADSSLLLSMSSTSVSRHFSLHFPSDRFLKMISITRSTLRCDSLPNLAPQALIIFSKSWRISWLRLLLQELM